jgi:outer membrane receptor protein involved in Fe transport
MASFRGVVNVTRSEATSFRHVGFYTRDDSLIAKPPQGKYPDQEHEGDRRGASSSGLQQRHHPGHLHYFATLSTAYSDVGNVFAVRTSETNSYLGSFKLNYTPRAEDQWTLFLATNLNDTANTVADKYVAPEFNADANDDRYILSAQQSHIFSETLFLESQFSYLNASRSQWPTDPNAHVTLYSFTPEGTYTTGRYTSELDRSLDRFRLRETLTKYTNRHDLKFGDVGYLSTQLDQTISPTRFDFRPLGNPLALHYYFLPVLYDESGLEGAVYAQDKWRASDRVTVDIGVRVEYQEIIGNTDIAPRLGFAWDVTGDARTKVYGNWGTYIERVYDRYLEWGSQPGGDYYFVFDPTGELADGEEVPGGTFGYRISGDNKTPSSDAWTIGVERLVGADFRLGAAYTDKRLKNQLLTYYISNYPEDWYEFRADGEGHYKGIELVATKRFSDNWEGRASYTWSEQTGMGAYLGTFYGATQIPPVNSIEDTDRTNVVKLSGFGQLPWGFLLSGSYSYATGLPYSIITYDQNGNPLYVGDRNSHRMPDIQSLDLSLQKTFKIKDVQVTLVAEGFNLTNHENVTAVSTAEDNHGEPTAFDVTRTFQLGFKVDF